MRLTTKGRYAVTAMLDLALHGIDRLSVWPIFQGGRIFPCPTWSSSSRSCVATG